MIAAAGHSEGPRWPAWYPSVLAVGALTQRMETIPQGKYDQQLNKPELFAPGHTAGTDLEGVAIEEGIGSAFAAMHALLAGIVLMAAGASSMDEVRRLLISISKTA